MKFSKIFLITTLGLIGFTGESNSFEEEPARNTASISDYERLDNPMYECIKSEIDIDIILRRHKSHFELNLGKDKHEYFIDFPSFKAMIDLDLSRQKLQASLSYLSICNSLKIHQRLMENTTWNQDESDKELRSQIENEIKVEKEILQKNYSSFDESQPKELIKSLIKMYTYMIIARDIYYCQSDINYMRCYLDDYKIDTFNELLCQFEGKRIIKGDGEYQTLKLFSAYLTASIVQYMRNTSYTFSSDFLVADIAFFDTIESMAANIFIETLEYRQSIASNNLDDHLFGNTFYSLYNYKGSKKKIKAYKYDHEEERMTLYLIVKNGVSRCLREEEEIEEKKEVE